MVDGLIHANANAPVSVKSLHGAKCCVCINDGYGKYRRDLFIKQKYGVSKSLVTCLNELSTAGHGMTMFRCHGAISDSVQSVHELPFILSHKAGATFVYKIGSGAKC